MTGDRFFFHIINTHRKRDIKVEFDVAKSQIASGRVFTLAADPEAEVIETDPDAVALKESTLPANGTWTFPAASVSAVEVETNSSPS